MNSLCILSLPVQRILLQSVDPPGCLMVLNILDGLGIEPLEQHLNGQSYLRRAPEILA